MTRDQAKTAVAKNRDKIAQALIWIAVELIATSGFREQWDLGETKKARSSTVECPECHYEVDTRYARQL
jgi:hypothetical protein